MVHDEAAGAAEEPVLDGRVRLLSPEAERRLMWRVRWRVMHALVVQALRESRLQTICVAAASCILWLGLFLLFREGFQFVREGLVHAGLRMQLIHVMFNVFFLTLTMMLLFSSAIILYGSLYRSEEVKLLLTTPARAEQIVLYKFHEAVFFSGWGFLLLGSPMLLAYGAEFRAPWLYYALLVPFLLAFVHVPAALGGVGCLLVVRLLPAVRVHALTLLALAVFAGGGYFAWKSLAYQNRDMMSFSWFQDVLSRLQFSEQRLLPSWWLSSGLLEATDGSGAGPGLAPWQESVLFLGVLLSNALLLQLILRAVAAHSFRDSYSSLQGIVPPQKRHRVGWVDRMTEAVCWPLPGVIRVMIIKDLRLFRRDPLQWSQFAIFFGLLMLYFLNVRRFDYAGVMEQWITVMSFLNVGVVGLLLSTFTTRFVFPSISLEGRRFWVLGTAPIARDTIIWGKFWFACVGAWPACSVLVLISDLVLGIWRRSWVVVLVHQMECLLMCVGLAALAVGLGARLPDLRGTSPARIASGFGGTLNLVLSTLYIAAIMVVTAVPTFSWAQSLGPVTSFLAVNWEFRVMTALSSERDVWAGLALGVALGIVATVWPLRVGLRSFRQLEQ